MGQKVHPTGIRLGITERWRSTWYAEKDYADLLHADFKARKFLKKELYQAGINDVRIERAARNNVRVVIQTARPGVIIGKKGTEIEKLRAQLKKILGVSVQINIEEIRKPEVASTLVAQSIADQLERRVMFRRAMKRAVASARRAGAEGVMVKVGGRLGGAEIARSEWYREGRVPLHTFRADIDFGFAEAKTTYGIIGVKVWIFKGEVLGPVVEPETEAAETEEVAA